MALEREAIERLRRSVAMLSPGQRATALTREEAMQALHQLQEAQATVNRLVAELRRLVADFTP